MKKLLCMVCAGVILLGANTTSVLAARPGFAFNVYAYNDTNHWTDNYYGNENAKSFDGQDWSLLLETLEFEKPIVNVGMAYAMFRNNTKESSIVWRTSAGSGHYSWNGRAGYSYNLKGRLDTDQPGYCISNGVYNADIIY